MYYENVVHMSEAWLKHAQCGLSARMNRDGCLLLQHPLLQDMCPMLVVMPMGKLFPLFLVHDLLDCMISYLDGQGRELKKEAFCAWFNGNGLNEVRFVNDDGVKCLKLFQGPCKVPEGVRRLVLYLEVNVDGQRCRRVLARVPVSYDARRMRDKPPIPRSSADRLK